GPAASARWRTSVRRGRRCRRRGCPLPRRGRARTLFARATEFERGFYSYLLATYADVIAAVVAGEQGAVGEIEPQRRIRAPHDPFPRFAPIRAPAVRTRLAEGWPYGTARISAQRIVVPRVVTGVDGVPSARVVGTLSLEREISA